MASIQTNIAATADNATTNSGRAGKKFWTAPSVQVLSLRRAKGDAIGNNCDDYGSTSATGFDYCVDTATSPKSRE